MFGFVVFGVVFGFDVTIIIHLKPAIKRLDLLLKRSSEALVTCSECNGKRAGLSYRRSADTKTCRHSQGYLGNRCYSVGTNGDNAITDRGIGNTESG